MDACTDDLPTTGPLSMEDEALALLRLRFSLIPMHRPMAASCSCNKGSACRSVGKHPRIKSWTEHTSGEQRVVRGWWRRWPGANIGIATGARSGIVVLDLDGPEGIEAARRLAAPHGGVPRTLMVRTGGGGIHAFFRWDEGRPLGNRVGLLPKVDFRGDGGCVIAAPSLHRSGRRYCWLLPEGATEPAREQILTLPDWLADVVERSGTKPASKKATRTPMPELSASGPRQGWLRALVSDAGAKLESASPGQRHKELLSGPSRPRPFGRALRARDAPPPGSAFKAAAKLGNYAEALGLDAGGIADLLLDAARRCGYFETRDRSEYLRVVSDGVIAGLDDPLTVPHDFRAGW